MEKIRIFDIKGRNYVSVRDVAKGVHAMKKACRTNNYLQCVVDHNKVTRWCAEIARISGDLSLSDPDVFIEKACSVIDCSEFCEESDREFLNPPRNADENH